MSFRVIYPMKNRSFPLIFLIPLLQILLGVDITLVSGQCLEDQRSLLLQLKNNLTFDSFLSEKLVRWNQSTDCCSWDGVTCNRSTGHVIGLDLNNQFISGVINSSNPLFQLQFLKSLNLAYNSFTPTEIPSGLFKLNRLTYLNLSNTGFFGQIPDGFSQMTRLVTLDLSTLYFPGIRSLVLENQNLSIFVQNLTELNELHLDGVNISVQGNHWCQAISSSLLNLRVLSLSNCYISGPIDSSLAKLQFLSVIRLSQNKLNAPIPDFFAKFKNLSALQLSSCNLSGRFPEKILQLQTLRILDLSNNMLLQGSFPELPKNGCLRTLVLSYTNFSGQLPDSIGNLGMLSRMELTNCSFSGKIPSSMEKCTQLVYLDFSSNNFSDVIPSFQNSKNLTYLDLDNNKLSGAVPSAYFEGLVKLEYVDLRFNAFNGNIPSTLFDLPSLRKLQLSHNYFDGPLANFSNPFFSQLDTLDLSSNMLNGSIPFSLFGLKYLKVLSLSSNNFTGKIRLETFWTLSNLTSLDLSGNNLSIESSGKISSMISPPKMSTLKLSSCNLQTFPNVRNQSKMMYLDLSSNQLVGEIPNWIWNVGNESLTYLNLSFNQLENLQKPYAIPNLAILDLHSNRLQGEIPKLPQTVTYVDFSANLFSSSIPENIGDSLAFAYFFSVSNNSLTGKIPQSICNATYLHVLDLSNNNIIGTIPPCLFEWIETLGVLNLGKNNLTGSISGKFPTTCSLETLDLHGNLLEGKIPESLANCSNLEVLNLGNNQINDSFPCFFENSSSLRVLVLRSNLFHGDIKCTEENNSWAELQIIDIASNHFTGGLSGNFLSWNAMKGKETDVTHLTFDFLNLNTFHYQDTVTVTIKGLELEVTKILTIFTSVDISSNRFEGDIPRTIGELKSLYFLNFSHNALTGSIPPSIGNLKQLESLDLSANKLIGAIPNELASLLFLSFLNLSNNQLTGRIPEGNQLQTFSETSFEGNMGLCGLQLNSSCGGSPNEPSASWNTQNRSSDSVFNWQFIFTGLGFGVGGGIVLGPLMFSKQGRHWWDECIDNLLIKILPTFGVNYNGNNDATIEVEDDTEEDPPDREEHSEDEDDMEDGVDGGRYCVFCSKIDVLKRSVVHNPNCHCHNSTTPIYSSSPSSSLSYSSSSSSS